MAENIICAGCSRVFTTSGHNRHLAQTTNPQCITIYQDLYAYLPASDSDGDDTFPNPSGTSVSDPEPDGTDNGEMESDPNNGAGGSFGGDYFGPYDEDEFDWPDIGENGSNGEDANEGSDEDEEELEWPDHHHDGRESGTGVEPERDNDEINKDGADFNDEEDEGLGDSDNQTQNQLNRQVRELAEQQLGRGPYIDVFPSKTAGAIFNRTPKKIYKTYQHGLGQPTNIWAPFASRVDYEVARWAKLRGSGSTAFSDLLKINGVCEQLGLSYRDSRQLNQIIDKKLPARRPQFQREEIEIAGEFYDVYFRDIVECVKALYGDPEFARYLVFTPERHYSDADRTMRMYHDLHTGKWWWDTQNKLEAEKPGATIIPIILSSDKTQVTMFRNKSAYPIYMTIGNIPKDIRRKPSHHAQILLAYLPTTRLDHITNQAARRRTLANLFHACMSRVVQPLKDIGHSGMAMTSGDGLTRRAHPLLACYVGDYPEQILVSGTITGDCPKCTIPHNELGSKDAPFELRDLAQILEILKTIDDDPVGFTKNCREKRIKPIFHPFWEGLPFANIFESITPDILHQVYQGMIKHLIAWIKQAYGEAELDARCRRLPPNHNIRLFMKGISGLARVSGTEHNQICRFLLGIIIDIRLPNNASPVRLVRAVRALLDFLYLSQYPCHTEETLRLLDKALNRFHDNKGIFVDLGIRTTFELPKLHSYRHYIRMIQQYGTTDNYNTEYTERLHIDLAKDAYRATNHKDEFAQMTVWLE
ncbi:hypothetical protein BJ138DRAFT_1119934 [Hygrophoropsis aurantiaca]|uniref:Uncharacterized protein n=1 Tax=Hygrophoropsis aurantiaca TaxID=72124 RepID=A0ACB7ZT96_9AGAM|nr:hypothetical protein BJ138DRAFT_1119934 [Hygrophoropsis aurantiaca]